MQLSQVIPKIMHVLEFLRVQHLEVPFISTYRQGYYKPDLKLPDLWEIYDWDEKWAHLQARKTTLRQLYLQLNVPDDYMKLLEESQSELEVQDLFDHYQMHFASESTEQPKYKRAVKRDFYRICKSSGITEFAKVRR